MDAADPARAGPTQAAARQRLCAPAGPTEATARKRLCAAATLYCMHALGPPARRSASVVLFIESWNSPWCFLRAECRASIVLTKHHIYNRLFMNHGISR